MNKETWVAMTGLCVLLATSLAQAHPITIEAEDAADGETPAQVTFSDAGLNSSAVYPLGCAPGTGGCDAQDTAAPAWQKARGKALSFWYSSADLNGDSSFQHGPAMAFHRATDLMRFNSMGLTGFGSVGATRADAASVSRSAGTRVTGAPWAWAFDSAGNPLGLTPARTFNQGTAQASLPLTAASATTGQHPIVRNDDQSTHGGGNAGTRGPSIVGGGNNDPATTPVPEPETLAMMMIGLLGIAVTASRRRKSAAKR